MADQQNPFAINTQDSPFAEYLQFAKPQPLGQPENIPGASLIGKTGKAAYFLDKFIEGAQAGTYKRQQLELAKERQSDQAINSYLQILDTKDPGNPDVQKLRQEIITERMKHAMSFVDDQGKKGKKGGDQKQNPAQHVLGALKSIGEGLVGGPVKKWEGYGDKMGGWSQQILSLPDSNTGYQKTQGALDQRIQQLQDRKKKGFTDAQGNTVEPSNDPITSGEIRQDPAGKALLTRINTFYKDKAGDIDKTIDKNFPDAFADQPADVKAAAIANARAQKYESDFKSGLFKSLDVGGALPNGITKEDVQGAMLRSFGIQTPSTKWAKLYNPETHKSIAGTVTVNPNTGDETIRDANGKEVTGYAVDNTRDLRPEIKPIELGGQKVYASIDMNDPDHVITTVLRDEKGQPFRVPETANQGQKDTFRAIQIGQKFVTDIIGTLGKKQTAINNVRNSVGYLAADEAARKKMEDQASSPYDALLKTLRPQAKAQLALVTALGGAVNRSNYDDLLGPDSDELFGPSATPPGSSTGTQPPPPASAPAGGDSFDLLHKPQ